MDRLDELEQRLLKAKEELNKMFGMTQTSAQGGTAPNTPPAGQSLADQIGFGKKEDEKEDEKKDEKKDKEMIEEKMDEHNEKKHGEPKDEDSAMEKSEEVIKYADNGQWSISKSE